VRPHTFAVKDGARSERKTGVVVESKRILLTYEEVLEHIARHNVRFPVWLKQQGGNQTEAELCLDEDDLVPYADLFFDDKPSTPLELWQADVPCQ
jgi:hypothetical protein